MTEHFSRHRITVPQNRFDDPDKAREKYDPCHKQLLEAIHNVGGVNGVVNAAFEDNAHILNKIDKGALLKNWRKFSSESLRAEEKLLLKNAEKKPVKNRVFGTGFGVKNKKTSKFIYLCISVRTMEKEKYEFIMQQWSVRNKRPSGVICLGDAIPIQRYQVEPVKLLNELVREGYFERVVSEDPDKPHCFKFTEKCEKIVRSR